MQYGSTLSHNIVMPAAFDYSAWRHGGWYVHDVRHPGGGCGCVSRNYPDKKWRVVCSGQHDTTYRNRDEAARAEFLAARNETLGVAASLFGLMARGFTS